ncbi:MAG TPA: hypothetical protein VJO52_12295 [Gemmatimonadaceae bacterium]|nr:hypothetical protein [Gemmatimonadaceae bacterium]
MLRRRGKSEPSADLLLAIGVGLAVGAGLALVARERARRRRPAARFERLTRRGVNEAKRLRDRGMKWASHQGDAIRDNAHVSEIGDSVAEYLETARRTIDDAVTREIRDLRRAIRRERKRLGV